MRKQISHSEVQTFLDCQKKWHLRYNMGMKLETVHTRFGTMAHNTIETGSIPSEELYPDLKEEFNIRSWSLYFGAIISELKRRMREWTLLEQEVNVEESYMKGKIDAVWQHKVSGKFLLTDYKFSNSKKDQMDLLIDQQLYVYAVLFSLSRKIPIEDIMIGFITIPKSQLDEPRVLKNGQLSKDKNQNVTEESYRKKIEELGLNVEDYQDVLEHLSGRELISLEISTVSLDMMQDVFTNIDRVYHEMEKGYYLEKASSFDCRRCDLFDECKVKRVK